MISTCLLNFVFWAVLRVSLHFSGTRCSFCWCINLVYVHKVLLLYLKHQKFNCQQILLEWWIKSCHMGFRTHEEPNWNMCIALCVLFTVVPEFVQHPQDLVAFQGESVRLECIANGTPKAVISWVKNGRPLDVNQTR